MARHLQPVEALSALAHDTRLRVFRLLVQAGADFLAVVGAVWNHPQGPGAGVRAMNQAIQAANLA